MLNLHTELSLDQGPVLYPDDPLALLDELVVGHLLVEHLSGRGEREMVPARHHLLLHAELLLSSSVSLEPSFLKELGVVL